MPATAIANSPSDLDRDLSANPSSPSGAIAPEEGIARSVADRRLEVINIRRAARINASNINEHELDCLLSERKELLKKKFSAGLGQAEERRLAYIRWSLDRIQDARDGSKLDELEAAVIRYEILGDEIRQLIASLDSYSKSKKKR